YQPSNAMRQASFMPHADARVQGELARDFLLARTAFFAGGTDFRFEPSREFPGSLNIDLGLLSRGYMGTAAAIDHRGYFLTAAHNLKGVKQPWYLVIPNGNNFQILRPRLVWRSDETNGDPPDLAVLHVSQELKHAFTWASEFKPGDVVYGVGIAKLPLRLQPELFAGTLLQKPVVMKNSIPSDIFHSAPIRIGDSGGPLVSSDGQLVGVEVEFQLKGEAAFHLLFGGVVRRPDLAHLQTKLDDDYRMLLAALPAASPP
ncbi:MAG: serine protease, partial [Opitutaceae bacterium]